MLYRTNNVLSKCVYSRQMANSVMRLKQGKLVNKLLKNNTVFSNTNVNYFLQLFLGDKNVKLL